MITLQDRIDVPARALTALRALFRERYLPGARARGMTLADERVSPPLACTHGEATLWLRWTLPDLGAWWAMRAASAAPAVAAFWVEVDRIAHRRERVVLGSGDELPTPDDVAAYEVAPQAWRETAQLYLFEGLDARTRAEFVAVLGNAGSGLSGLLDASLSANMVAENGAGDYSWDLLYRDREAARNAQAGAWWRETVLPALAGACRAYSALGLHTLAAGARDPGLRGGVKRTALFRLLPGVDAQRCGRFERDLLDMPAFIPAIRNWRLSRAEPLDWNAFGTAPWSHVWEQEFGDLDGLTGPYMTHPHHWAHVDRWFDVESGTQIIETALCHAFSPLEHAMITR